MRISVTNIPPWGQKQISTWWTIKILLLLSWERGKQLRHWPKENPLLFQEHIITILTGECTMSIHSTCHTQDRQQAMNIQRYRNKRWGSKPWGVLRRTVQTTVWRVNMMKADTRWTKEKHVCIKWNEQDIKVAVFFLLRFTGEEWHGVGVVQLHAWWNNGHEHMQQS